MKPIITFNAGSPRLFAVSMTACSSSPTSGGYGYDALQAALAEIEGKGIVLQNCAGVGHRIVHGGTRYTAPVRADQAPGRS
jgi:acetate kinase